MRSRQIRLSCNLVDALSLETKSMLKLSFALQLGCVYDYDLYASTLLPNQVKDIGPNRYTLTWILTSVDKIFL